jgi:hypothetical protein
VVKVGSHVCAHLMDGPLWLQGSLEIPLRDLINVKSIKNTYTLRDVKQGTLALSFQWLGILEAA